MELQPSVISGATESAVAAFNDANVILYAVDARLSPTCLPPVDFPTFAAGHADPGGIIPLTCSQPPDISDEWMEYLANATGGRAVTGGKVVGIEGREAQTGNRWGAYHSQRDDNAVSAALRIAMDDVRYAYEIGFYVPESELDGKVHQLIVTVPAKPKLRLRYRRAYTASASAPH